MTDLTHFDPLRDLDQMSQLVADASGVTVEEAHRRLLAEQARPGTAVSEDFAARGGRRYEPGSAMDAFYGSTDAFLYELAVWNRNRLKRGMRKWITRHMDRVSSIMQKSPLEVLSIGDGMGFDCLHWARHGHRVTYFELPGDGPRFAERLFRGAGISIPMLTDPASIPTGQFDAITCLDVLEHVPDVPGLVKTLVSYLRPGGVLYVSAPYFLILPWYPTHLRQNRRYSASLSPYREAGLNLIGGRPGWDPIVLQKPGGTASLRSSLSVAAVRGGSLLWLPGRFMAWPYAPLHYLRKWTGQKFE
ncbi:class I SAM-dependent methyltransferase [Humisphaera borealis]|uniref:Class I SAM-dependent methyltransferase n=1 Tax=Humisphaera borealis TaxID=2807512 RepID=A0A7M2X351_9BACT|nr:class I SAM-dependent methyltransferase [Humisphaera borealis]QOV92207.1 class I SAM-dependent methyltransferase [Humisphaera borealis]